MIPNSYYRDNISQFYNNYDDSPFYFRFITPKYMDRFNEVAIELAYKSNQKHNLRRKHYETNPPPKKVSASRLLIRLVDIATK